MFNYITSSISNFIFGEDEEDENKKEKKIPSPNRETVEAQEWLGETDYQIREYLIKRLIAVILPRSALENKNEIDEKRIIKIDTFARKVQLNFHGQYHLIQLFLGRA